MVNKSNIINLLIRILKVDNTYQHIVPPITIKTLRSFAAAKREIKLHTITIHNFNTNYITLQNLMNAKKFTLYSKPLLLLFKVFFIHSLKHSFQIQERVLDFNKNRHRVQVLHKEDFLSLLLLRNTILTELNKWPSSYFHQSSIILIIIIVTAPSTFYKSFCLKPAIFLMQCAECYNTM
jgi:hypothetical protein